MKKLIVRALLLVFWGSIVYTNDCAASWNLEMPKFDGIIGGSPVSASDPIASSTVLLVGQTDEGQYICTGSIIESDMIITAAHCVGVPAENMRVVFSLDVNDAANLDPGKIMKISGYVANPNFKGEEYQGVDMGDIAVVRLNGALPANYKPAKLLADNASLHAGQATILAGFGITNSHTQDGAGKLRKVATTVKEAVGSTEEMITETSSRGACNGDSGGPAFVQSATGQLLLWGVTSRGDSECASEGIYTRINAYIAWIGEAEAQLRAR